MRVFIYQYAPAANRKNSLNPPFTGPKANARPKATLIHRLNYRTRAVNEGCD
jgi:hypothetical protein